MHSRRVWLAVCRNPATLWPVLRAWVNEAHRTQYVFSFGMIVCRLLNKFGKQCIQAEGAARRNAEPREPIGPPPRSHPTAPTTTKRCKRTVHPLSIGIHRRCSAPGALSTAGCNPYRKFRKFRKFRQFRKLWSD